MGTVTEYDSATIQNTNNLSTYNSGNIAPALDQLLVVTVIAGGTVDEAVLTAAANGVSTFHLIAQASFNTSLNTIYKFVANQKTTGTATMQVTFDCTGDAASGVIILVDALNDMTKVGADAVRSVGGVPQVMTIVNGPGASTPDWPGFPNPCLTGNITQYGLGEISSAGIFNPTGWTQGGFGVISNPTLGGAYGYRNSGFTGTDVTWPGNETAHGGIFVEFDTSADEPAAAFRGWGIPL